MNKRFGVLPIFLALCAACGPDTTASTENNDWKLDDNKMAGMDMTGGQMDMGSPEPDQGIDPIDQGMTPVDQGPGPIDQGMPGEMCGDGVVDPGEQCDGDCPAQVADCPAPPPEACARVSLEGAAATCDANCVYYQEDTCIDDDGCCPDGCSSADDNDCTAPPEDCGNGMLDDGETCDGDCYQSAGECPDLPVVDACTRQVLAGSADMCNVTCETEQITDFDDTDGCCPPGGTPATDTDCIQNPVCGNGVIEQGESCDGDCPMSDAACDDLNACTTDSVMGDAAMCQAMCVGTPITACMSGDGCCPAGCGPNQDSDCVETDLCGVPVPIPAPYDPASVVDFLELGDASVGFDFTGNGQPNNALGSTLDQLGALIGASRADFNQGIASQIATGQLALVLEHANLTGLIGPASFSINLLSGEPQCFTAPDPAGTNYYYIDPSSYNVQGSAVSHISPAAIDGQRAVSAATTNPVVLPINLLGLPLLLPLEETRLTTSVNVATSGLPDRGVALSGGTLGGYVRTASIYDAMSDVIDQDCSCVARPANTRLISYSQPDASDASCTAGYDASNCFGGQSVCREIVDNCSSFTQFLPLFADVDSTRPGMGCGGATGCDSMSMGFEFTAAGARILGVGAP